MAGPIRHFPHSLGKVQKRHGLGPGSLTLSPQPAAPHQGHFFKGTFQDGVRQDLSEEPQDTQTSSAVPEQLWGEKPQVLSSLGETPSHQGNLSGSVSKQTRQACLSPPHPLLQADNGSTVLWGQQGSTTVLGWGWGQEPGFQSQLPNLGQVPCSWPLFLDL